MVPQEVIEAMCCPTVGDGGSDHTVYVVRGGKVIEAKFLCKKYDLGSTWNDFSDCEYEQGTELFTIQHIFKEWYFKYFISV